MKLYEVTRREDRQYLVTYLVEAESLLDAVSKSEGKSPPGKLVHETMEEVTSWYDVEVWE